MDPDAALQRLGAAIRDYLGAVGAADADAAAAAAETAIDAMVALDSWLSMGGFLPSAWQARRNGNREPPDHT